ncbi:hypothetical protein [Acidithiobacillus sulfurivorans]|uniref:PilZ domain-containing protein n=1 Tax=Acidithiobacillus sulfurivorans TaxID=1958756 RepID=A0ABS5ZX18_9PROT|nr:hypothetical protein [Acidithiobacillus sulfurivorans]MBU2758985.1 hypothetical protein [Acidithiobacillus sulfurivorans]
MLIELRLQHKYLTLFREQAAVTQQIAITKMTATSIQINTGSPLSLLGQIGEKVLCVYYGTEQSLGFLSTIRAIDASGMHIDYPKQLWLRNTRKHDRFSLTVNMTAYWSNPQQDEPIYGQVMDVSYGGFLGGMHMAAYDDGKLNIHLHEQGEIILLKSDHSSWKSQAELRRSALVTRNPSNTDGVTVDHNGFALLGFAFIFNDKQQSETLEKFLEGSIEPL